jgi:copper homeostasis protein (lipoprotein)
VLATLLEASPASAERPIEQMVADALGPLPAGFTGVLPCADCPGVRYQLDLYPDQAFVLRTTYLEREPDNVFDDIGGFLLDPDG